MTSLKLHLPGRRANERIVSRGRKTIAPARGRRVTDRAKASAFVTYLVPLMCLYGFCLRGASSLIAQGGESTPITIGLLVAFTVSLFVMIRRNGSALSDHGLTMTGWQRSLVESLVWTSGFVAAVTLLKLALVTFVPALSGQPLFSFRGFQKYGALKSMGLALSYAVFVPVQEFIARGALQISFQQLLVGRWVKAKSIVLATLLFATTHLHMSMGYAVVAMVPGLFWGVMYARQKSLFGVSVSHVVIGLYVAFVLGVPGMGR